MPEVHRLIIQVSRPGRQYKHGRVAEGHWLVDEQGFVHLTTETGVKLDIKRKCPPNTDPKVIACLLLKQSAGGRNTKFDRRIVYPQEHF